MSVMTAGERKRRAGSARGRRLVTAVPGQPNVMAGPWPGAGELHGRAVPGARHGRAVPGERHGRAAIAAGRGRATASRGTMDGRPARHGARSRPVRMPARRWNPGVRGRADEAAWTRPDRGAGGAGWRGAVPGGRGAAGPHPGCG